MKAKITLGRSVCVQCLGEGRTGKGTVRIRGPFATTTYCHLHKDAKWFLEQEGGKTVVTRGIEPR